MPVAPAMRHEEYDAEAGPSFAIREVPLAVPVELHQRIDPAPTVEIGPLIGEAQMHFDDASADRLEVGHAAVTGQMAPAPVAVPGFDIRLRLRADLPVIERTVAGRDAPRVAPPARQAVDQRHVAADVIAFEQRHPHMPRLVRGFVVL